MADRRRRRQVNSSQENLSEGESQQPDNLSVSESEGENGYVDLSEYESAEEDYESEEQAASEENDDFEVKDLEVKDPQVPQHQKKEKSEDEKSLNEKSEDPGRESGDGKSDDEKDQTVHQQVLKIKEDEDSPLFIPTKGNFYQHDVRSEGKGRGGREMTGRAIRREFNKERWAHDKYNEEDQTPKSREEIVEQYGYDIRAYPNGRPSPNVGRGRHRREPAGQRRRYSPPNRNRRSERYEERPTKQSERGGPPARRDYSNTIRSQNFHASRRNPPTTEKQYSSGDASANSNAASAKKETPTNRNSSSPAEAAKSKEGIVKPERSVAFSKEERRSNTPSGMGDVLEVINNREQAKPPRIQAKDRSYSNQRRNEKYQSSLPERLKNMSISNNKEPAVPRRYSSLRQRATEASSKPHRRVTPQLPPEWRKQLEPEVTAPVEQSLPETEEINNNSTEFSNVAQMVSNIDLSRLPPIDPLSLGISNADNPSTLPKSEGIVNGEIPAQSGLTAPLQWYEAALAYQQAMLSQSLLNQSAALPMLQQPTSIPSPGQIAAGNLLFNNEPKPTDALHLAAGSPTVNQGDLGTLGSLVFPPPPVPQNYPPNSFMQRNVLQERPLVPPSLQLPFPPNLNLVGQQVGGVTYYPNPLQPVQNVVPVDSPVGSPMRRLNSAIPIKHPFE